MPDVSDRQTHVEIVSERLVPIHSLQRFQSHHRTPQQRDRSTQQFIAGLAETELATAAEQMFQRIRREFQFKRKQISLGPEGNGIYLIQTPDFYFELFAEQDAERPDHLRVQRQFSHFQDLNLIQRDEFAAIVGNHPWRLRNYFVTPCDVVELIDAFEEAEIAGVSLDFPGSHAWLDVMINSKSSQEATLRIESDRLEIRTRPASSPAQLSRHYAEFKNLVSEQLGQSDFEFSF